MRQVHSKTSALILSIALLLSGCTSTLVRDDVKRTAGLDGHCSGSEWVDDSSLAVLPVPVVAFFVPHFDLHKVASEPYLNRCGASTESSIVTSRSTRRPAFRLALLGSSHSGCGSGVWRAPFLSERANPAKSGRMWSGLLDRERCVRLPRVGCTVNRELPQRCTWQRDRTSTFEGGDDEEDALSSQCDDVVDVRDGLCRG